MNVWSCLKILNYLQDRKKRKTRAWEKRSTWKQEWKQQRQHTASYGVNMLVPKSQLLIYLCPFVSYFHKLLFDHVITSMSMWCQHLPTDVLTCEYTTMIQCIQVFQIAMDLNFSFSPSPNKRTRQAAGLDRLVFIPCYAAHMNKWLIGW